MHAGKQIHVYSTSLAKLRIRTFELTRYNTIDVDITRDACICMHALQAYTYMHVKFNIMLAQPFIYFSLFVRIVLSVSVRSTPQEPAGSGTDGQTRTEKP